MLPAFRPYMIAHLAADERHRRIRAPRPAEVRLLTRARQRAIEEHEPERNIFGCSRGGNVRAVLAVDRAVVKDHGGFAEDKIDPAFDVAIDKIRASIVVVEGVLPA